jgi:hypothetical protein
MEALNYRRRRSVSSPNTQLAKSHSEQVPLRGRSQVKPVPDRSPEASSLPSEFLEEMKAIFSRFDVYKSGKLSISAIMQGMRDLGEELYPEEAEDMLCLADVDGDGFISFEDFISVVMS